MNKLLRSASGRQEASGHDFSRAHQALNPADQALKMTGALQAAENSVGWARSVRARLQSCRKCRKVRVGFSPEVCFLVFHPLLDQPPARRQAPVPRSEIILPGVAGLQGMTRLLRSASGGQEASGHDFSRAASAVKSGWASAPEVCFLVFQPLLGPFPQPV
jgi:hypothetical protein